MEGNIQQLIDPHCLPGNCQVAVKDIQPEHGRFEQVWERYETGIKELIWLPRSVAILIKLGDGLYSIVDANHHLIVLNRLKELGEEVESLSVLLDGTMTVSAIVLRADTPDRIRLHIGSMMNYSNETHVPMTPYDTYVTMSRAITFANSNGRLLTNSDIVRSFEGAGKTIITQVNSWLAVARYYHVIPNTPFNNRSHFRLPIGVIYAEGTVKVQIVDRNPDPAETFIRRLAELPKAATQKEVKELAKLWGEVYLPWINGVNDLNSSQGWTDEKKEQATELIIA
ncbi:hypothetical protein HDU93_002160, partial [Gonapodya sp. JEL0774]